MSKRWTKKRSNDLDDEIERYNNTCQRELHEHVFAYEQEIRVIESKYKCVCCDRIVCQFVRGTFNEPVYTIEV